jgi:transposase
MKKDRPIYTPEFRQNAIELTYARGKSVASVARDLGISVNTLHDWRRKARLTGTEPALPADATLEERFRRLERELELVRQERDILKKTIAYFAERPT